MIEVSHDEETKSKIFKYEAQMDLKEAEEVILSLHNMPEGGLFVEWGSGASTVYWLLSMVPKTRLVSIEHDKKWYDEISQNILEVNPGNDVNFKYYYRHPMYEGVDLEYATLKEEHPYGMRDYIIPDEDIVNANVCFIDGVCRGAVIASMLAFSKNPNAVYYLHDYVGREDWYGWIVDRIEHKRVIEGTKLLKFSKNKDGLYA